MDGPLVADAMDTHIQPFAWTRLLLGDQPPLYLLEVTLRCLLIYLVLLLVMRLMGKRGQSNLSPMQQILLIALGSAAGDVLFYPDVPLAVATIVLLSVTLLTMLQDWLAERSTTVREYVESHPRILVRGGVVDEHALDEERTDRSELYAQLRVHGARSLSQVDYAILEVTGEISVFLNDRHPQDDDLLQQAVRGDRRQREDSASG